MIYTVCKSAFLQTKGISGLLMHGKLKAQRQLVSRTVFGGSIQLFEGGVIPAFVGPLLKGAAALLSAVCGACNFHLFLESRVENAGYAMAYEAEMSRLMKEEQDSK